MPGDPIGFGRSFLEVRADVRILFGAASVQIIGMVAGRDHYRGLLLPPLVGDHGLIEGSLICLLLDAHGVDLDEALFAL